MKPCTHAIVCGVCSDLVLQFRNLVPCQALAVSPNADCTYIHMYPCPKAARTHDSGVVMFITSSMGFTK